MKKQVHLNRLLLVLFISIGVSVGAFAQTIIYVNSLSGSDANDGLTSSTAKATITAGIAAASTGGIVEVEAGSYTETINVNKSVTLKGPNTGIDPNTGSRMAEAELLNCNLSVSSSTGPVTIDGFTIKKTGTDATHGINLTSSPSAAIVTVQYNIFDRNVTSTGSFVHGVYLSNTTGVKTIKNNKFTGNSAYASSSTHRTWRTAVWLNSGNVAVQNNVIDLVNTGLALETNASGYIIEGNTFKRMGTGLGIGSMVAHYATLGANEFNSPSGPTTMINLTSTNSPDFRLDISAGTYGGISFKDLPLTTYYNVFETGTTSSKIANQKTNGMVYYVKNHIYVRTSTSGNNRNLQTAINLASTTTKDIIVVQGSNIVREESVTINKSLELRGAQYGMDVTTRNPTGNVESKWINANGNTPVVTLNAGANDVVIDGFSIYANTDNQNGIYQSTPVSNMKVSNNFIRNFTNTLGVAIAAGTNGFTIEKNSISNNYAGIYLSQGAKNGVINNNVIFDHADGSTDKGAAIATEANNTDINIVNNKLSNNGKALYIWSGQGSQLTNFNFKENSVLENTAGVINALAGSSVNAFCNWWGTDDEDEIANLTSSGSGNVDVRMYHKLPTSSTTLGFEATTACYGPVTNVTQGTYYATIQSAIDNTTTINGDIISVTAGTYPENIIVNKELDIRGPNYGTSYSGTREPEAIIIPATTSSAGDIIKVRANNVSINGFTFDGDNIDLSSSLIGTNGADIDAGSAISIDHPNINFLSITNNLFKNLGYFAVNLYGSATSEANTSKTGHLIKDNKFTDLGYYKTGDAYTRWGGGVVLYNSHYARVEGNLMENVRIGIQTGNFQTAHIGDPQYQTITNNTIQTRSTGIFYNLHRHSPLTISQNTITALFNADEMATATRGWNGMLLSSLGLSTMGNSPINNNTIDGGAMSTLWTLGTNGITVWNVASTSPANIKGGTISNVDNGIFLNNFEGYSSNATDGAHAVISDITISPNSTGVGIKVLDSPNSTSHANVVATIGEDVKINDGLVGLQVENASAKVISPIGNISFTGQTGDYIRLIANTNNIDASAANFENVAATTMSLEQTLDIEEKITDKDDDASLGQVLLRYGVINLTKEAATLGSIHRYTTIQAAIDAADSGDEIVADPGIYNEQLTINKPLTLKGAQAGVDPRPVKGSTRNTDGTGETILEGPGNRQLVNITSSNVVFDGFLVRHTTSVGSADLIGSPETAKTNIKVSNNILLNATDEGIQLRKTNDAIIETNFVSGSKGDGINICLNLGGSGHKIINNEVLNSASGYGSIYLYDVDDVEVKGNYVHGFGQGVNVAAADAYGNGGCKDILIHYNDITSTFTLHPSGAYAVGISGTQTARVNVNNNTIRNTNTTDNSSTYIKLIDVGNTPTDVVINDNLLDLGIFSLPQNRKYLRVASTVTNEVNASCNWYGSDNQNTFSPFIEALGAVSTYPFLSNGNDTDGSQIGFVPETGICIGKVHNITKDRYFLTIQNAINAASDGDVLEVSSGTYDEQVLVNKGVKITKPDGEISPIVKFTGTVTGKPTLFDVSADKVVIDGLRFEVDLAKLKSAVIASGTTIDDFTFTNNEIAGHGIPMGGNYSDRNAVSINHVGNTNYRVGDGVDKIVFSNNTVDGEEATFGFFRAALAVDAGAVEAKGNTLRTINHDILVRFNSKNPINITDNVFNGGGVEIAEQNGGSGKVTVSDNEFNGVGAPNYALLRVKNNQSDIEHQISNNTFNDYKWAVSLENMKNVTVEANTFTTSVADANAVAINTKSMSSNSSDIVQTTIDATIRDNDFAGTGRGIVFLNHDSDNASFGTFVIGESGKENKFSSTLSSFVTLDNQTGPSSGSTTFPIYGGSTGLWVTPMACWSQNINAENNTFDVGSGLKLPAALNATERETLESKLTHKPDFACLGSIHFFNPVHNVTQNTYFSKIQDAVDEAIANDVIELSEWTFTESVEINKSLTIQGVDKTNVILSGTGLAKGSGFKINSGIKNVTIKNLTIQDFDGTNPNSTAGIYAAGGNDGLNVKDVDVKNNTNMSGFYANGPVDNISIDGSSFTNHGPGARGIVIWNGLKSNISLTNNYLSSNNCCGIELQDGAATGVLIKGNTVYAEDSGISAVGLMSGSGGAKANIIDSNFVYVKQRFGIEIKNPNGTGNDDPAEDGAIIVSRNEVTHSGPLTDLRDLAGIAVHRRGVSTLNVNVPTGVIVKNNKVSGFVQPSLSTGFGIVLEGTNHTATDNTLTGNDVGIQQQSGHLPYPADGDQANVDDMYFGRGNSPIICNLTVENNTFSGNALDKRIVVNGAIVTEITPTVNPVSDIEICNNGSVAAIEFTGNTIAGKVYKWTNSHPSIGLSASGTGNIASFTATNTTLEPIVAIITVTPELANGCKGTPVEFTITVNPTPEKPVINPAESTICEGSEVTLVTTCLVGTAHWSNSMTGSSITISPITTTSYTAKCIDALGCEGLVSNPAVVNVIARPAKPTLTASATTICNGLSVLLTASSCVEGKYIWSTGVETTENTLSVTPTSTQNYSVTCSKTATLTCVSLASDPVTINVNTTSLSAPTTSGNVLISSGATTTLTASCSTGTPAWFDLAENLVGSGSSFTTPALTVNTDYNVRCVNSITNLSDCKSAAVLQRISIDNFSIVNHPQHIYVCLGQNAFLSVGATGRSITYQWEEFNGTAWAALTNGGKYSGVNSNLLNIQAPGLDMSDYRYRCVITNTAPDAQAPLSITSNPGVLSVSSAAMANNITMASPITGLTVMYQAVQAIVGTNKINSGNIKYFAGNSITLEPGFEVTPGSVFTAKIQIPCTNTSSAVPIPDKIKY